MMFLLGVVMILVGVFMIVSPESWYELTESWKNNAAGEASDLYCLNTRIGGVCVTVAGIGAIILQFMQ